MRVKKLTTVDADYDINKLIELLDEYEGRQLESANFDGARNKMLESALSYGAENQILNSENFDGLVEVEDFEIGKEIGKRKNVIKETPAANKQWSSKMKVSTYGAENQILQSENFDGLVEAEDFEIGKEIGKRKNVIKETPAANKQWSSKMKDAVGKAKGKKLMKFLQITDESQINHLCTSLEHINSLREKLNKLNFYRTQQGITLNCDIKIYEDLKVRRRHNAPRVKIRDLVNNTVPTTAANYCATSTVTSKQPAKEISHLPRLKDLTTKEAEFCSSTGLVPELYLNKKDLLTSRCKRSNGILLKTARSLAKMDVNKTRKLYDFLMEQDYIWIPGNAYIQRGRQRVVDAQFRTSRKAKKEKCNKRARIDGPSSK